MDSRRRTLFEQQELACAVLECHSVTEAQRRTLVRTINAESARTRNRHQLLQFAPRWLYDRKQIIPFCGRATLRDHKESNGQRRVRAAQY